MKRITLISSLILLLTAPLTIFSATPQRPTKEPSEMRSVRHQSENLKIEIIQYLVKSGKITQVDADYKIAKIKQNSTFMDNNPTWVQFRHPKHNRRMQGRRQNTNKPMVDKQNKRPDRGDRRLNRANKRRHNRNNMMLRRLYKGLQVETTQLKDFRHKAENLRIQHIQLANKIGRIDSDRANFRIKRIKSNSIFKDNNPKWVAHKRYQQRRDTRNMDRRKGQRNNRRSMDCDKK